MNFKATDSLIFDMDGTLWNATASYCKIWKECFARRGVEFPFLAEISEVEDAMMPQLGGKLFDGVQEGIAQLSRHYKLFMVSNCSRYGLHNFMKFTHTERYFTDTMSYGERSVPKSENIKVLIDRYGLKHAVYLGDTQSDCNETHRAGIKFAYAAYGFVSCSDYDIRVDSFAEFTEFFMKLKEK